MPLRWSLLKSLFLFALLGAAPALAADAPAIPEGCVDESFCDGKQCYPPESSISRLACACGLLNPVCGVGRCEGDSYCEGRGCGGDDAFCHPASSPVSQIMCAGAPMGDTCDLPPASCGQGSCVDGAFCDACGCQPLDAAASQALCACKLADPKPGLGICRDGAYCDDLASEHGSCYLAEAVVSQAMCQGVSLQACALPPASSDPGECKDGVFCQDGKCHPDDSALSKARCTVSSAPKDPQARPGLMGLIGPYDIGVIPKNGFSCPTNSLFTTIYMDDEDSSNANYTWGWIGATEQNRYGTKFGFCRVNGTQFRPLSHNANLNVFQETYAVLKLGDYCPMGSKEFIRHFDNEDRNNANSYTGFPWPNVINSNTTLRFCMFEPSYGYSMPSFPNLGVEYGVFAPSHYASPHWLAAGFIHTDDEDRNNANWFSYDGANTPGFLVHSMIGGASNTDLRLAKVSNGRPRCSRPVQYFTGAYLMPTFDGMNCFIRNAPARSAPFISLNGYYVMWDWFTMSCPEGVWDGTGCRIMTAPAGTTPFVWGNRFYYGE
ncbi:hypothetical protein [Corallococcus sp. AB038B]|uniref:hypothetical protein n=2 Tax=Corallococcus TaxID=83461 RepID=UPI000EDA2F76|nr:hypothetical protein [Corallococcus sp. AB038B]RKH95804.1 hypothetical protein D7Y04_32895 [Corallococcus sp. AB038B]